MQINVAARPMMSRQYDRRVFFCTFQLFLDSEEDVGETEVESDDDKDNGPSGEEIDE